MKITSDKGNPNFFFYRSIKRHREKVRNLIPQIEPLPIPYKDIQLKIKEINLPIRIYRPEHLEPPYPTIFYIRGTAFVANEMGYTQIVCPEIANTAQCQVIILNHRLAPEHQYPVALQDAYTLFRAVYHADQFRIDQSKIVLCGYSSGGNLVPSIAMLAKSDGISITRQILVSPLLDLSRTPNASYRNENNDLLVKEEFVRWTLQHYVPEKINRKNPWLSPLWHKLNKMKQLPPTDIFTGENDRFVGDSKRYAYKLTTAKIDTKITLVDNANHSFWWFNQRIIHTVGKRINDGFGLSPIIKNPSIQNKHEETATLNHNPFN